MHVHDVCSKFASCMLYRVNTPLLSAACSNFAIYAEPAFVLFLDSAQMYYYYDLVLSQQTVAYYFCMASLSFTMYSLYTPVLYQVKRIQIRYSPYSQYSRVLKYTVPQKKLSKLFSS